MCPLLSYKLTACGISAYRNGGEFAPRRFGFCKCALSFLRRLERLRLRDGLLLGRRRAVAPQAALRPAGTPHWMQIARSEFGRFQDFASGKILVRRTPGGETRTASSLLLLRRLERLRLRDGLLLCFRRTVLVADEV